MLGQLIPTLNVFFWNLSHGDGSVQGDDYVKKKLAFLLKALDIMITIFYLSCVKLLTCKKEIHGDLAVFCGNILHWNYTSFVVVNLNFAVETFYYKKHTLA